jgi:phage shock protein E
MPNIAKESEIILYCRSGGRSARAKNLLLEQGYSNVENAGGLDDVLIKT